jgi:hypothetical protein
MVLDRCVFSPEGIHLAREVSQAALGRQQGLRGFVLQCGELDLSIGLKLGKAVS